MTTGENDERQRTVRLVQGDYVVKKDGTLRKHGCWRYVVDAGGTGDIVWGPLDIHNRKNK